MRDDQGLIIAKRAVSLSKTYSVIAVFMTIIGALFGSLSSVLSNTGPNGIADATRAARTEAAIPYLAIPFQSLAAIFFATPVLLLFVYDKNNGVLEYLLSLGMSQRDIFRQYLKATLILALAIVGFDVIVDSLAGLVASTAIFGLTVSGLVVLVALSAVSFGTMLMMLFSSLQKQRVGSNQPLGAAIGSALVLPSVYLPLIVPSIALWIDLILAVVIAGLSLVTFLLSGRLISREKLLP